ncbi:RNA 3'-phosphate cyclase, partial [Candidatus Woesearchaeota archaeon]|nr:RNA 3'-phosphate cyclase [Candidatus Woesearchaeota archaeon]
MPDVILDGSYLEGGGQIVRNALALSVLTGKSFSVSDIRKGRSPPGLKAQHLFCVKAAARLSNAEFTDIELGSTSISFFPNKLKAANLDIDIGTAGSISLFLQSVLIPAMFANAPIKISVIGGTDGKWAMPFDYIKNVFLPHIQKYAGIELKLLRRGFYPKGGGKISLEVKPKYKISDFENFQELHEYLKQQDKIILEEQGKLLQVKGISNASKSLSEAKVAERQASVAEMTLKKLNCPVQIAS